MVKVSNISSLIAASACFFFIVFVFLTASTQGLMCYNCNSLKDEGCEPLDTSKTPMVTCTGQQVSCAKIDQEYNKLTGTIRNCSVMTGKNIGCIKRLGNDRLKMNYCYCQNEDGCNPGVKSTEIGSTLVLTLLSLSSILALIRVF